jgi:hypothetical protein
MIKEERTVPSMQEVAVRLFPKMFLNRLEEAIGARDALRNIGPEELAILRLIKSLLRVTRIPEIPRLYEFPDHRRFMRSDWMDLTAIQKAVGDRQIPGKFYVPLLGGLPFLVHVPSCDICLYLMQVRMDDPEVQRLANVAAQMTKVEQRKRGYRPGTGEGETFTRDIQLPPRTH